MDGSAPSEIGVWQHRHREMVTAESQSWPCGIDGPIQVAPTALYSNVGLIHAPRFVGRLDVPPQPLFQLGTVTLQPAPNGGVVDLQAAFLQKLFHIPKRQGVSKVPAHRAENEDGLAPLQGDRGMRRSAVALVVSPLQVRERVFWLGEKFVGFLQDSLEKLLKDKSTR
jgi:hypothetical protein